MLNGAIVGAFRVTSSVAVALLPASCPVSVTSPVAVSAGTV